MHKHLCVIALALVMGACSYLPTVSADATKAENAINGGVAKADAFVTAKIAPTVEKADAALIAKLGPALGNAVHAVFCGKYAQKAYDASEAKNQPACTARE